MTKRLMYVATIEDTRATIENMELPGGALERLVVWTCSCPDCNGDKGAVLFGRNSKALWVINTHSRSPDGDPILGLESAEEIDRFGQGVERRAPKHARGLREAMLAEFRGAHALS